MIQSCITISLVSQARGGPFVFWDDLAAGCAQAQKLGFDAVEIFAPAADAFDHGELRRLLDEHGLALAALGTGAGWVIHRLQLCAADAARRRQAKDFIRTIIDVAGEFGAFTIVGSMQGRWDVEVDRPTALGHLRDALAELGEYAAQFNVPLVYEPLNRYETNLCHTMAEGVELIESAGTDNVKLLADLFHMNIEETDLAAAIRTGGRRIGHLHFVDSNRRAAGFGHLDFTPIAAALREIDYQGYASAEALPLPTPEEAAAQTMRAYRELFVSHM